MPGMAGNGKEGNTITTLEERLAKLEVDATANTVVQRQLTENIEALTKKVDEGFVRIETQLSGMHQTQEEMLSVLRRIENQVTGVG